MRLATDHVQVRVPATSANLGPGFDSLGMALARYDEIDVKLVAGDDVRVRVSGEGAGRLPTGDDHLVVRAMRRALEHVGAPLAGVEMTCANTIPHGRGLGSSAAAVVAGIVAARTLISEPLALDNRVALELATEFEGHADNAAPALLGGATIAWTADARPRAARFLVKFDLETIVLIPTSQLATKAARAVLPATVPHSDAAFNSAHSALLVHALAVDLDLLWEATADRLHQDYREAVMPGSVALMRALRAEGLAAVISGAGPCVLVLTSTHRAEADVAACHRVTMAVGDPAANWRMLRPGFAREGAAGTRL